MCVFSFFFFFEANTRQLRNATQISYFFLPSFALLSFLCNQKTKFRVSKAKRNTAMVSLYNFISGKQELNVY